MPYWSNGCDTHIHVRVETQHIHSGVPPLKCILWQGKQLVLACFWILVLYGGNPGEHGEYMKTPHRKAWEKPHLRTCSPVPAVRWAGIELRTFLLWGRGASHNATYKDTRIGIVVHSTICDVTARPYNICWSEDLSTIQWQYSCQLWGAASEPHLA